MVRGQMNKKTQRFTSRIFIIFFTKYRETLAHRACKIVQSMQSSNNGHYALLCFIFLISVRARRTTWCETAASVTCKVVVHMNN